MGINPEDLAALSAKRTHNGGEFGGILQPDDQLAHEPDPTDLAECITATTNIIAGLVTLGLMKAS